MRKKIFTLLIVLLIVLLTFSLVACGEDNNYDGNVTIIVNLDKDYGDIQVNCPEGDIEKNSNTKYTIKLNSTLPIDIILQCDGFEKIVLRYKTEDLKNNSEITENVSFKSELYRFSFAVQLVEVKLAQEYSGIKLISQAGAYILESERPIKQDIILDAGEDYKQVILFKEVFKYVAAKGKLPDPIPVIGKNDKNVAVFVQGNVSNNTNLIACNAEKYESSKNNTLNYGKYNLLETANYAVFRDYNSEKHLLKLKNFDKGYYCFTISGGKQFDYYLLLKNNEYRISRIQADFIVNYYSTYDSTIITTNRELVEGESFVYEYYNQYTGGYTMFNVHIVTKKDVESGNIDLSSDNGIEYLNGKKFMLRLKDKDGNKIEYDSAYFAGAGYDENKVYEYDSTINYSIQIYHSEIHYHYTYIDFIIASILAQNSDEEIVYIDYVPIVKKSFDIKYKNILTGQIVDGLTTTDYVVEGEILENLSPSWGNYSLVNNEGIIYFEELFGDSIVLDVVPNHEIKIKITNVDIIEYENEWQTFSTADGRLNIWPFRVDETEYHKLNVSEQYAGKSLRFTFKSLSGEIKYYFDIVIPENFTELNIKDRTFEVTVTAVDNEW